MVHDLSLPVTHKQAHDLFEVSHVGVEALKKMDPLSKTIPGFHYKHLVCLSLTAIANAHEEARSAGLEIKYIKVI